MGVTLPPFWSLVEAHGAELLVHARRLTSEEHAEDVLQEAMLRALRSYPRLAHGEHLRAWLYRVTTSAAMDHHRARRREIPTEAPPAGAEPFEYDDGAFEALIAPLPEATRSVLRLRFVDDLDYGQLAARLGCSPVAARQRVSAAVRTLRKRGIPA
jgi:RNA polymerase sigma-70 factor, ECF subfamily